MIWFSTYHLSLRLGVFYYLISFKTRSIRSKSVFTSGNSIFFIPAIVTTIKSTGLIMVLIWSDIKARNQRLIRLRTTALLSIFVEIMKPHRTFAVWPGRTFTNNAFEEKEKPRAFLNPRPKKLSMSRFLLMRFSFGNILCNSTTKNYLSGSYLVFFGHNFLRPVARRLFKTSRPLLELIRDRKPWTFTRRRLFGWYVLFGIKSTII